MESPSNSTRTGLFGARPAAAAVEGVTQGAPRAARDAHDTERSRSARTTAAALPSATGTPEATSKVAAATASVAPVRAAASCQPSSPARVLVSMREIGQWYRYRP